MARLVVMKDPTGALGKEVLTIKDMCLLDALYQHVPNFHPDNTTVVFNGKKIEFPTFDEHDNMLTPGDEELLTRTLEYGEVVCAIMEPKDPFTLSLIVAAVVAVALIVMMPEIPDTPKIESGNNDIFGQENTARPYQAIPDCYGLQKSYPDLITSEPIVTYDSNNNKIIRQFMCVGIGRYQVLSNVRLGATPIDQIQGATASFYEPDDLNTTTIPEYVEQFTVEQVEGQRLRGPTTNMYSLEGAILGYDAVEDKASISLTGAGFDNIFDSGNTDRDEAIINITWLDSSGGSVVQRSLTGTYAIDFGTITSDYIELLNAATVDGDWVDADGVEVVSSGSTIENEESEGPSVAGPFDTGVAGQGFIVEIYFPRDIKKVGGIPIWGGYIPINNSVQFELEYVEIDGPGGAEIGTPVTESYAFYETPGDVIEPQTRVIEKNFGGDNKFWRVTLRRLTYESDDTESQSESRWSRLASKRDYTDKTFTGVTIVDVSIPQSAGALSPRKNKVNFDVMRKVKVYDPVTRTVSALEQPSERFADAVYHVFTEVFKRDPINLSLDELFDIQEGIDAIDPDLGKFCYTFDDLDVSLGQRIDIICNACRVTPYIDGNLWRFTREEAKPSVFRRTITGKDMAAERDYTRTWRSRLPDESDGITIEYVDPETGVKAYVDRRFNKELGTIENARALNPRKMVLAGVRNLTQATNRADLEVRRLAYYHWVIQDTLLSQANTLDIGDIVYYADVFRKDVLGGEIIDIDTTNTTITISEEVRGELVNEPTLDLHFTDQYGQTYGPYPVTVDPANSQVLNYGAADLSKVYLQYLHEVQLGSRFILSIQVNSGKELFEVKEKHPSGDGTVGVMLAQYDERIFEND